MVTDTKRGYGDINSTVGAVENSQERFKSMCFIQQVGENQYRELLEELKKGTCKGRYKYPNTEAGDYELLVCIYLQICPYTRQIAQFNHCGRKIGRSNFLFLRNVGRGYCGRRV